MAFPSTIDTPGGIAAQGTTLLTGVDHGLDHRTLGSAVVNIENKLGLGVGSAAVNQLPFGQGAGTTTWGSQGTAFTFVNSTFNNGTIGTPSVTGGTTTSGVFGTPAIDVINARNSGTALGFGNSIYPSQGSLTDVAGGTLTANAQTAQIYYCVMGTAAGNRTIGTPTSPTAYQQLTYAFKSSGSANGTIVWATSIFRGTANASALGTGTSWNYWSYRYNGIDSKWDFMGQITGIL